MIPLISAIILAAGESRRMGEPKQLMPLGKTTILERTVDNFLNSEVHDVIVVVGYRAEEVISLIADRSVAIAVNSAYREGMSTSIVAGLSLISNKTQGVMLALADQPFIDSHTINHLIEAFGVHNKNIAIPVYQSKRGHPVIFAIKYKEELLRLKGDIGGREIIGQHPDDILEVTVDCEGICVDIDTIDNYNSEEK
jgi:molybdenum cofactor cytidylyltransferase